MVPFWNEEEHVVPGQTWSEGRLKFEVSLLVSLSNQPKRSTLTHFSLSALANKSKQTLAYHQNASYLVYPGNFWRAGFLKGILAVNLQPQIPNASFSLLVQGKDVSRMVLGTLTHQKHPHGTRTIAPGCFPTGRPIVGHRTFATELV